MITCYLPDGSTLTKPMANVEIGDVFRTDAHPEGPTFKATSKAFLDSNKGDQTSYVWHTCHTEVVDLETVFNTPL